MRPSFSRNGTLSITHPRWQGGDLHAAPSRAVDERYHWDARRAQFVFLRRVEGDARKSPGGTASAVSPAPHQVLLRNHLA